jgi:peroxiredoxin
MKRTKLSLRFVSIFLATLVAVLVTNACSGNSQPQASQQSSGSISAAQISGGALPKQAPSAQPEAAPQSQAPALKKAAVAPPPAMAAPASAAMAALPQTSGAPEQAAAESQPAADQPRPAVDLTIPVGPQIGNRAPEFTLQGVDGQPYKLSDLIGRPVVINYWATWCIPCKTELPILQRISQEYASRGVVFITVDAIEQDSLDKVQTMMAEIGMSFPVLLDQGNQFANAYGALFFPTTYFVDPSGVIRHINLGDASEEELRGGIENLLAGGL